jgi:hypothetical protein
MSRPSGPDLIWSFGARGKGAQILNLRFIALEVERHFRVHFVRDSSGWV